MWGIELRAANEADNNSLRQFSSVFAGGGHPALFSVTYNSYPATAAGRYIKGAYTRGDPVRTVTTTVTPTLNAAALDPDNGQTLARFEVWNSARTTMLWAGDGGYATAGSTSFKQVPAGILTNGTYSWRVKGFDGTDVSKAWSSWADFTVDTTAPAAPTVASSAYPAGTWQAGNPAGTFTFTRASGDADVYEYAWRTDDGQSGSTLAGSGTSATQSITPAAGWRTLTVAAVDVGGNRSPQASFSFGAGAAVTSPGAGASTQQTVRLAAVGPPGSASVSWSYRLQATDPWTLLPLTGDATTYATGGAVSSWPVSAVSSGAGASAVSASPALLLDLHTILAGSGGEVLDGAVQLQAAFTGGTSSTTINDPTVTLDQNAFGGGASEQVGPGSVSLLTGNVSVSASDASIDSFGSDLTLSRTFNSRTADMPGIFGPGWLPSLSVDEAGSDYTSLTDLGSSVTVTDADGASLVFARTGTGGTYQAQGDAEGLVLRIPDLNGSTAGTGNGDANGPVTFTLADEDGNTTTFSRTANWSSPATLTATHVLPVTVVTQPTSNSTTSYSYDTAGRPTRMLAPHPSAGVNCNATWQAGCRALDLTYGAAGGTQLSKATLKATDGTGAPVTADVACFSYDSSNRLTQAWDPRITAPSSCGTPVLATSYSYDSAGRLATVTPAGLAGWTLSYDGPSLAARLSSVTRTHSGTFGTGSESTTLRYKIPINDTGSGVASGLHPDLSAGTVAGWGQSDLPVTATAVFGPGDSVPALPLSESSDLRDASVTALNADGRVVNTAAYTGTGQAGWRIDTSQYDSAGRLLSSLTAANRDRALGRADAGDSTVTLPADTAEAARQLSTINLYTANPNDPDPEQALELDLTETFGPLHEVTLPDGTRTPARQHTRLTYDTGSEPGHPAGGSLHLVTASTVSASLSAAATATALTDSRTTTNTYALGTESTYWTLRTPVRTTSYTGSGTSGTAVSTTTITDATGLLLESRMPADTAGTGAGTTLHTYYTTGSTNNASCVNTNWVRLLCRTAPKAQPGTVSCRV